MTNLRLAASDLNEDDYRSFLPSPGSGGQIQLWQFLLELLDTPGRTSAINGFYQRPTVFIENHMKNKHD